MSGFIRSFTFKSLASESTDAASLSTSDMVGYVSNTKGKGGQARSSGGGVDTETEGARRGGKVRLSVK